MKANHKSIKDILLVRTDNLGDIVLTLPAVFALKKTLPSCAITLVVNVKNESLVKGLSYIDKIVSVDINKPEAILRSLREIRKCHYDVAIQLLPGNDPCGSFLVVASWARHKVGYGVGFFGHLFNYRIKPAALGYEVENVMEIIRAVVPDLEFLGWGLESEPNSILRINEILDKCGAGDSEKIIVIHPVAARIVKNKIWPADRFVDLIKKINGAIKAKFFLVGAEEDRTITQRIKDVTLNTFDLSGVLSLTELASLIKKSSLMIANNSGPLQIAVALDVPTVSLMGPSLFERWAPQGARHIVIKKERDCIPCEGTARGLRCSDNICMQMISVDEVFEAVKSQINKQ